MAEDLVGTIVDQARRMEVHDKKNTRLATITFQYKILLGGYDDNLWSVQYHSPSRNASEFSSFFTFHEAFNFLARMGMVADPLEVKQFLEKIENLPLKTNQYANQYDVASKIGHTLLVWYQEEDSE